MPMGRRLHRLNSNFSKKSKKWPVRVEPAGSVLEGRVFEVDNFCLKVERLFWDQNFASQPKKRIDQFFIRKAGVWTLKIFYMVDFGCLFCFFVVLNFLGDRRRSTQRRLTVRQNEVREMWQVRSQQRGPIVQSSWKKRSTGKTTLATQRN